ncbi:permease-like cell division protein FtsX [Streptobacillus moniliformis]|uniref:cell division protein FtsX n=1 Tax=Streptobacillus moniliformis TaxID=34105 RepID=UPI0007E3A965|nr:permease-like cell division protein FtsX [Streptobacillus moniliformis]QXW65150.1 permease-like cell division protein FtsX [Streptobacillus moniliformis]
MTGKLFGGVKENIRAEKGAFFSAVTTFILIFTLINIFVFGALNADSYRLKEEQANQVILYIKDLDDEGKKALQEKVLNLDGVSSLRFVSKDVALKSLEKELSVDLSLEPNPLEDTFFVHLKRDVNIDELNVKLSELTEVSSIDLRAKVVNQTVMFSAALDYFIKYAIIFLIIFSVMIIFNIVGLTVKTRKREIYESLLEGKSKEFIKTTFFLESVLAVLISGAVSYIMYVKIRGSIVGLIEKARGATAIQGFSTLGKETNFLFIVLIITIILVLVINYLFLNKYYNIRYYEKNKNEEIQEVKEEVEEDFQDLREEQ